MKMSRTKTCGSKDFEPQIDSIQHYGEYLGGIRAEKKGNLSYENNFQNESIDDYFTSIQILSNAILLKKFKIRSKTSGCSYYKLYSDGIILEEDFDIIELIRVNRNLIHYNAYESSLISEEEINSYVELSKSIIQKLKSTYGGL